MAADGVKQMFRPQVLTTWHSVGSAAAFPGTPETWSFGGKSGTSYGTSRPPPDCGPTQPASSPSQQPKAFSVACSAAPVSATAVYSVPPLLAYPGRVPLVGGALSLQKQMELLTSTLTSLTHPLCAPHTPQVCIQPLDSLPLPRSLCRCNLQESQALQLQTYLTLGFPSSSTARTRDSMTNDRQTTASTSLPPSRWE